MVTCSSIAGSDIYSGAPGLVALAALRTGAGLSIVIAPEKISGVIRSFSPTLVVHSLPGDFISTEHVEYVEKVLDRMNSVVIGPGLGTHPETRAAVRTIISVVKKMKLPLVVDADAITSLKGDLDRIRKSAVVLTPNAGEFEAISGVKAAGTWQQRARVAIDFAKKVDCTVLLKGHNTVITDGFRLKVNGTGNPSMATGGAGDVLSGIIGTYLAQANPHFSLPSPVHMSMDVREIWSC